MCKILNVEDITSENLVQQSEEDVYNLMNTIIRNLPNEKRNQYMDELRTVFDFRSISPTKRTLRKDMILYGYKFFPIPNNDKLIMGIKRKIASN